MNRLEPSTISADESLRLHQRLLNNDPLAPQEFCVAVSDWLFDQLRAMQLTADEHLLRDAVHQTLFDFCKKSANYDPGQLALYSFLVLSAERDLRNLLRKNARHEKGRVSWNSVEIDPDCGKYLGKESDPLVAILREESSTEFKRWLHRSSEDWTEPEKRVLQLLVQGEDRLEMFAQATEVTELPREQQELEVKRVKDRILKRLKRENPPHE